MLALVEKQWTGYRNDFVNMSTRTYNQQQAAQESDANPITWNPFVQDQPLNDMGGERLFVTLPIARPLIAHSQAKLYVAQPRIAWRQVCAKCIRRPLLFAEHGRACRKQVCFAIVCGTTATRQQRN